MVIGIKLIYIGRIVSPFTNFSKGYFSQSPNFFKDIRNFVSRGQKDFIVLTLEQPTGATAQLGYFLSHSLWGYRPFNRLWRLG